MSGNTNAPNRNSLSASDLLAMERTKLTNIQTLLSYIRTSLTFFAVAAALIEFFNKNIKFEITAYISISLGVILLLIGFYNYYRSKKLIKAVQWIK
jgi:putative membrane protein